MSLLKDLDSKIVKALEAEKEMFPYGYKKMIKDIQDADLVTDIPVGTAMNLLGYAEDINMNFESDNFVLKLYQMFGK